MSGHVRRNIFDDLAAIGMDFTDYNDDSASATTQEDDDDRTFFHNIFSTEEAVMPVDDSRASPHEGPTCESVAAGGQADGADAAEDEAVEPLAPVFTMPESPKWVGAVWYMDEQGIPFSTPVSGSRKEKTKKLSEVGFDRVTVVRGLEMDAGSTETITAEVHLKSRANAKISTMSAYGDDSCNYGHKKRWREYCHAEKGAMVWGMFEKKYDASNLLYARCPCPPPRVRPLAAYLSGGAPEPCMHICESGVAPVPSRTTMHAYF
jgi:hypothetical protein